MIRINHALMLVGVVSVASSFSVMAFAGGTEEAGPAEAPAASAPAPAPVAPPPAAPTPAAAETPSPWSANVSIASQYVSRGLRQTWGQPAIQGGIDYANPNGWSAGTWLSNVSADEFAGASTEHDLYGGYTKKFNDDLSAGAIFYHYRYANANYDKQCIAGGPCPFGPDKKYDYNEIVPQITYKWFTLKDWITVFGDYFGFNGTTLGDGINKGTNGSQYIDANINYDLSKFNNFKDVTLLLHVGHEFVRNHSDVSWTDYKVGLSKTFGKNWNAGIAWTKANAPFFDNLPSVAGNNDHQSLGKGSLIVSVGRTL